MKNIQIQTQKHNEQLDIPELANLTCELWKITRPELNSSIDGISNWIKNLRFEEVPVIVKAYKEEKLLGWLLLFVHDSKRLEINPWALGGHPHILPNEPDRMAIAQLLLKVCLDYAKQNAHTRIELCYEKKESKELYPVNPSLYPQINLIEEDEIVFMTLNLEEQNLSETKFPEELDIIPLKDVDDEDLYSCFYNSFSVSDDRNFFSQTEEERVEYFKGFYEKQDELIDEASIVLVKRDNPIGFVIVKPTHGAVNGHLWVIGVIPEYRRQNLGSKLMNHVIVTLKKENYKTMSLAVDVTNKTSMRLYEKFNFVKGWRRITHVWKKNTVE